MKTSVAVVRCAATVCAGIALGQAFAPMGALRFEVGTIKPTQPGTPYEGVRPAPGGRRYTGKGLPLRSYLYVAYQVREEQIAGGPSWLDSDKYDLNAEAAKPDSIENLHIMLQNFLTDQLNLKFHFEKKEMQAYVVTPDKGGPKNLTPRERSPGGDYIIDVKQDQPFHQQWDAHCVSINFLTWRISGWMDRPVINQTGLEGCFDLKLQFRTELPKGVEDGQSLNGQIIDASGPTLQQAVREQLGLKVEAKKAEVETMVIDHAERPAAD